MQNSSGGPICYIRSYFCEVNCEREFIGYSDSSSLSKGSQIAVIDLFIISSSLL